MPGVCGVRRGDPAGEGGRPLRQHMHALGGSAGALAVVVVVVEDVAVHVAALARDGAVPVQSDLGGVLQDDGDLGLALAAEAVHAGGGEVSDHGIGARVHLGHRDQLIELGEIHETAAVDGPGDHCGESMVEDDVRGEI